MQDAFSRQGKQIGFSEWTFGAEYEYLARVFQIYLIRSLITVKCRSISAQFNFSQKLFYFSYSTKMFPSANLWRI